MISIVTGTLNRIDLLKRVIDNTVNSNNKLELILVDGGSTDGTIEYIKELNHENIKLIEIGGRSSYPHYMNLGVKESKYDWVAQWNDDVLLINNWEDVFKELSSEFMVYIFDWGRLNINEYLNNELPKNWIFFRHCMNFGIYKKDIFKHIGLYDSKFNYYECDHDMTTRCSFFGYNPKMCHHIKVIEINTEKKAIPEKKDEYLARENMNFYRQGILPESVELLK